MKIYVAGPMRGIPEFNFPAFNEATAYLRAKGHTVFNPAERDNERHGIDISKGNATGDESIAAKEHGFNLREALGADLAWICAEADGLMLLPGWQNSKGAQAEVATAKALGLQIAEYGTYRLVDTLPEDQREAFMDFVISRHTMSLNY